ncbi:MAG: hypothetical protein IRZ32_14095 [Solirubrobacteraceae bacterium]|nr:hypothetical protein [Solirubrobacteraceae bacterium]
MKTLLANLPADLAGTVGPVLTRTLTEARAGRPLDDSDGSISAASTAIDRWVHDRCGYPMLDATTDGTALSGVPTSLPAGPLAISFTTTGDPTTAGFALLLGKVKDGQTVTAADVQSGRAGFEQVTDIVGAAGPGVGARPGYSVTTLTAGRYIVASPLGSPPTFTGLLAVELTVR